MSEVAAALSESPAVACHVAHPPWGGRKRRRTAVPAGEADSPAAAFQLPPFLSQALSVGHNLTPFSWVLLPGPTRSC